MKRSTPIIVLLSLLSTWLFAACSSDPSEEGGLGQACYADGTCDGELVCQEGVCTAPDTDPCEGQHCSGHGECQVSDGVPYCVCDAGYAGPACSDCDEENGYLEEPAGSGTCVLDPCFGQDCEDGARRCADADSYEECLHSCWQPPVDCPAGQICIAGDCEELICSPEETVGCADGETQEVCNAEGTATVDVPCPAGQLCSEGACFTPSCTPGETRCADDHTPERCAEDGSGFEAQTPCADKAQCVNGACLALCDLNSSQPSNLGCDFVALDLPQIEGVDSGQLRLLLSNPHPDLAALLELHDSTGNRLPLADNSIPAGSSLLVDLPRRDIVGTGLSDSAYLLSSDLPIAAVQLNPAGSGAFSSDASRLIPVSRAGLEYWVLNLPSHYNEHNGQVITDFFPSVSIVSVDAGPVDVTITSPVALRTGHGLNAVAANTPALVNLLPMRTLTLATEAEDALDLSGLHIQATGPVVVFASHMGATMPFDVQSADHLEVQLLPVSAWGENYLAPTAPPRGTEPTVWRVLAAHDNTNLVTQPSLSISGQVLDGGQVLEFVTDAPFALSSDKPVMLAQFTVGAQHEDVPLVCGEGAVGIGDPAMLLLPATTHYATEHMIEIPEGFGTSIITLIHFDRSTRVDLDGQAIPSADWIDLGNTQAKLVYRNLTAGTHHIQASAPVGLLLHGWNCSVEYAVAGAPLLSPQ